MQNFLLFTVIQYVNVHLPAFFITSGSVNYKLFLLFCLHAQKSGNPL